LRAALGPKGAGSGEFQLKAPMPGLVVAVPVTEGQAIQQGDVLVILESMKMQNELKAPRAGTVTRLKVKAGDSIEQKQVIIEQAGAYFKKLWNERVDQPPKPDLLSMMAHSEATRNMDERNFLGNLFLLIIGGNDTTRNSISGAVYALNKFPDQYRKLRENPALIESFVPEVIRWQTPLSHMRRTALADAEIGGKAIKKGDKVVMWYVSGNRDDEVIENPNEFIIDRKRPRNHLSFGFGIHRCVGLRLAELQLKIVWEEILKRFETIEMVEEPKRVYSSFIKGYETLPVRIAA
jgi:cytochrome P450